jgi:Domain of unknown function (DUF3471)
MKKIVFVFLSAMAFSFAQAQTPAPKDSLSVYTGKYKFPDGSPVTEITVSLENGVLTANSAMGSSELRRTEGDVFEIVAYSGTATFKRNEEKKVTGMQVIVGSINMEGTKSDGLALNK